MQLTAHFSFEALIASDTAVRLGIDNRPPARLIGNLLALAEGLEQVRAALGGRFLHLHRIAGLGRCGGGERHV